MIGRVGRTGGARAVIALVALYGLFLQAFLSGMLPAPGVHGPDGISICAPADAAGPEERGGKPARHDCCIAACPGPVAAPPDPGATAAAWPPRSAVRVSWTPADTILSTGPPVHAASARGPPSA